MLQVSAPLLDITAYREAALSDTVMGRALLVIPGALASLWLGPGRRTAVEEGYLARAFGDFLRHNVLAPFVLHTQLPTAARHCRSLRE